MTMQTTRSGHKTRVSGLHFGRRQYRSSFVWFFPVESRKVRYRENDPNEILQGNVDSGGTLTLKISVPSVQWPPDGGEKKENFLSGKQRAVWALTGGRLT